MTTVSRGVLVRGELRAAEDITVEGRIDGSVFCEHHAVTVGADAEIVGDVIARDITVMGRTTGQLVATDVVDIRADAAVRGTVVSARFILNPSAQFDGRVEPQHLEAALRVAKYEQRRRDGLLATR